MLFQGRNVKDGQPALVKQLFMPPREEGEQWSAIKETALLLPQAAVQHEKSSYRIIGNADGELLGAVIPTLQSQGIWGRYLLLTTFLSVCRAVENLHAVGKVHGAIHPNHVLVRKDSSACLLCFHPMPIRLEKIDPYRNDFLVNLSQEQLRGFGSPATDVYGLGVLLFQVFGDALPYSATSPYDLAEQTMWGRTEPFHPSKEGLDDVRAKAIEPELVEIGTVAAKAIHRDASLRFSSVEELRKNLEPLQERLSPLQLGLRLFSQNRYALAARVFEEAVQYQDPVVAHLYLGRIYGLHMNRYEQGVLAYKHALKAHPGLEAARLGLAEIYSRQGRHALAKNEFVELLTQRPNDQNLLMMYAQALAQDGNLDGALNIITKVTNENPYYLPAYASGIQMAVDKQDFKSAEAICSQGIASILKVIDKGNLDPGQVAQVYYERGRLHRLQGRLDQAIKWLDHAFEQAPGHAPSHLMLAQIYSEKGEMDLALKHFTMCLKLDPRQSGLLEDLEKMFAAPG